MLKRFVIFSFLILNCYQSVLAVSLSLKSPVQQVGLLELYTSEGCSSCPPADAWLSIFKSDPRLWQNIVPMGFHVDYWDYIGWKDRFASPAYSKRQKQYAAQKSVSTVYTPGFVFNGREWRSWFGLRKLDIPNDKPVGVLDIKIENQNVMVNFKPIASRNDKLEIHIALLGFDLSSHINAGENSGRKLNHDFVVLGLHHVQLLLKDKEYSGRVRLPTSKVMAPRHAIAAWITPRGGQRPIQAIGGWLPNAAVRE